MFIESLTAKTRVRQKFLPFTLPSISDEEINEVTQTLRSGWLTSGPKTKLFEKKFAEYIGCQYSIAVNSGSAGLHLSLIACGIKPGDEVILPAFTFSSTVSVINQFNARPIFVDVGDDMNIKVSEIPRLINSKTKFIVPVDFAGQPAALTEILAIAKKHNLTVIEDASHAVGSSYRDKKIGSVSPITLFSFDQTNNMTTGEGGMICTNNDTIADKIRNLGLPAINHEQEVPPGSISDSRGFNYNITDIQSALGLSQLAKLNQFISIRRYYAKIYNDAFRFIPEISLPTMSSDSFHCWHLYIILLNLEKLSIDRSQFIEALNYENIGTSIPSSASRIPSESDINNCRPNRSQSAFRLPPNAQWLSERIVSIPLYPKMTEKDVCDTIRAIKKITKRMAL